MGLPDFSSHEKSLEPPRFSNECNSSPASFRFDSVSGESSQRLSMILQLVILQVSRGGGGLMTLQQLVFFRPPIIGC